MKIFGFTFFEHRDIYGSRNSAWPKVRKQHLSKHPRCAACGSYKKLEVHHIIPVHLDPDKELCMDNLITLCDDPCHFIFGHLMDYKSWNIDVKKDCSLFLKKRTNRPYK